MRILYLHQYFKTPEMAGGTRSYEMARRLVDAGHDVQMITSDTSPSEIGEPVWRLTQEGGIDVHWFPVPYSNFMGFGDRMRSFLRFSWQACRHASKLGGDLVFATSTPLTIAIPAIWTARRLRVPMVFEVRDLWPAVPIALGALSNPVAKWGATRLEHAAYRNAHRIVALAPGMKDWVVGTGFPDERVTVIPNGADLRLFDVGPTPGLELRRRTSWLKDRPLVLYAGALGAVNSGEYLVELAAKMRQLDSEIRFAVIGGGNQQKRIRALALERGVLDNSFFMLGTMQKSEIPRWLAAATVATAFFTGPEILWRNATQNKFFDAIAAGKPVACNFRGFQSIVAEKAGCGLILDARNPSSAARVLLGRLRDQSWLQKASRNAARLARQEFSRDSLAERLLKVLELSQEEYDAGSFSARPTSSAHQ